MAKKHYLTEFDFPEGKVINNRYSVLSKLGGGYEGEVYLIRELNTKIERAAKFFYPHRNVNNKAANMQAKKLHQLRHCSIVIGYHFQEFIEYKGYKICCLVSDFVKGEILSHYIDRQPGKRLSSFQAVHLLHALAKGVTDIHSRKEYHGDLHTDNIIIQRFGLGYDLKVIDLFHWSIPKRKVIQEEICDMIRIFYDSLGGAKYYGKQPQEIKNIILGLKKSLIAKKFRSAAQLKNYLEEMEWN